MGRYWTAAVLVAFATSSCNHQPPPYESQYTPNPQTGAGPQAQAGVERQALPTASFSDNFDRPDTEFGLGEGWDLRGRGRYLDDYPLPPATDGFVRGGSYTYAGKSIVYAVRQFQAKVERMGTVGHWRRLDEGTVETTVAMAISADENLISNMIHFAANRGIWRLTVRRSSGEFEPVADGRFVPTLSLDTDHQFEVEVGDNSLTVRVPGSKDITTKVDLTGLTGERAFWEEYAAPESLPANVVFDFDTVWAAEAGQELKPVSEQ